MLTNELYELRLDLNNEKKKSTELKKEIHVLRTELSEVDEFKNSMKSHEDNEAKLQKSISR